MPDAPDSDADADVSAGSRPPPLTEGSIAPRSLADPRSLASLDQVAMVRALRPLWEDAGPLATRLLGMTFGSWTEVVDAAETEIATMSDVERTELLRAHPRLGEAPGALRARSEASWREQSGNQPLDADTATRLHQLNERYEAKFGFPFVEWVRGRPLAEVIAVIEARIVRDRPAELEEGCLAMIAIARDRLARAGAR